MDGSLVPLRLNSFCTEVIHEMDFSIFSAAFWFSTFIIHFLAFSVMVNSDGFMDYIVELIDNMSRKTADQLRANPLVIAHCIGAMKILTAISIAEESHVIYYHAYLSHKTCPMDGQ